MRVTALSLALTAMTALLPSWAMASDREIAQQVAQQIYSSGQLQDYTIMVKYSDGTAYLKGEVRDEAQLRTALDLARQSPHVRQVVNMVTISGEPTGTPVNTLRPSEPTAGLAAAPQFGQGRGETANAVQFRPASYPGGSNHHLSAPQPPRPVGQAVPGYGVAQVAAEEPQQIAAPVQAAPAQQMIPRQAQPMPVGQPIGQYAQPVAHGHPGAFGGPVPAYMPHAGGAHSPIRYDQPHLPSHAWPSYAAYPNYAAVTYPKQYSAAAWPYIGPFYPYPQVPLGWRKVTLEWDDGWWFLDFKQRRR